MTATTHGDVAAFCSALRFAGARGQVVAGGFAAAEAIERIVRADDGPRAVLYEPFAVAEALGLPLALKARGIRLVEVAAAGDRTAHLRVGLTGARLGVAESGSLLVGGQPGGWGLATILPWIHVAVLRAGDIRPDFASAFAELAARFEQGDRDWVWITGPSKTADIAKTLVMGIHGPNRLEVVVVDSGREGS